MASETASAYGSVVRAGDVLDLAGDLIDGLGVLIMIAGVARSIALFVLNRSSAEAYDALTYRAGHAVLRGLEMLLMGEIVRTLGLEPTAAGLAQLVGLVLVRTFLGWTLRLEAGDRSPEH